MVKVAVIGAGTMGTVHAQAYQSMPDVSLVGIVDIRLSKAQSLAELTDTRSYSSLESLLENESPDVIDVCVPTPVHRSYVEAAAKAGKHVVCEKPLARTLEDAEAMIEACSAAGVRLFVGQVVRFFPEYQRAHDLVESGAIGSVGTARTMRGGSFPGTDWYANVASSGSLIVDLMVHDFDFLRWCFGDVERVFAKSLVGRELAKMDHSLVSLRFKNGVIAHCEGTWAYPSGFRTELEIAGSDGLIRHDSEDAVPIKTSLRGTTEHRNEGVVEVPESPLLESPYKTELAHFMKCIQTGEEPIISAHDAYKALEISLAALHSAQTGEVVTLS